MYTHTCPSPSHEKGFKGDMEMEKTLKSTWKVQINKLLPVLMGGERKACWMVEKQDIILPKT